MRPRASDLSAVGAYAVVRGDAPAVYLAENAEVLARVLALHLVAQLPASTVTSDARLQEMRAALLEERWSDALVAWIEETDTPVDVYAEGIRVWGDDALDTQEASFEIRMAPLFGDGAEID